MKLAGWILTVVVAAGACSIFGLTACGGQQEGQRCSTKATTSESSDCTDGLICYSAASIGNNSGVDLCCPADLAQATAQACRASTGGAGASDASIPDASFDPDADAGSDATTSTDADAADGEASVP